MSVPGLKLLKGHLNASPQVPCTSSSEVCSDILLVDCWELTWERVRSPGEPSQVSPLPSSATHLGFYDTSCWTLELPPLYVHHGSLAAPWHTPLPTNESPVPGMVLGCRFPFSVCGMKEQINEPRVRLAACGRKGLSPQFALSFWEGPASLLTLGGRGKGSLGRASSQSNDTGAGRSRL